MIQLRLLHIVLALIFALNLSSQDILDECFTTIWTGPDFENGEYIVNTSDQEEDAADMLKYLDEEWTGTESAVTAAPPLDCIESRAIFLEVLEGEDGEGFGMKLSSGLQPGQQISFEVTYISHGPGSDGNFAPRLYSHHNSEFQSEGFINAQFIQTLPPAGTAWETHVVQWNVTSAMADDDWIFLYANASSGVILNICQAEAGQPELGPATEIHGCLDTGIEIGEVIEGDVDYSWSNGQSGPYITAMSNGTYILYAQNECNVTSRTFLVSMHGDPELTPENIEDIILCEGDSLELSSFGLNVLNTWPDGSNEETYWINNEGAYALTIEDDCGVLEVDLEIDYDTIPFVDLGPDRDLCEGQTLTLDGSEAGEVDYLWQDGSTNDFILVDHEEVYALTVYNDCGAYTDEVDVIYHIPPEDILPSEVFHCVARLPEFDLNEFDGTFVWSDGTTGPIYTAQFLGYHWVDFTDSYQCFTVRDSVLVTEGDCACPIFLPNAFTPDGDGLNDVFRCEFECAPYDYTLEIFDRWGNVAFRTRTAGGGWDGKMDGRTVQSGVYHFRIWYRESFHSIPIEKFGTVTLVGSKLR